MPKLCVELVGVNFSHRELFGYRIILFLDEHPFQMYGCLHLQLLLPEGGNIGVIFSLVELFGQ